jgi:hypothetical protein
MAVVSTTNIKYLDGDSADGTVLGQDSSALVGLWGATPVAQRSNIADIATSTITTAATSTTPFGFATSTQADAVITIVADLRTKFNTLLTGLEAIGTHAAS